MTLQSRFAPALLAALLLPGSLAAATPVAFHPGELLQGLTLDPHGAGAGQIVATWEKGLAAIDAATLEITDLDGGISLGRLAATEGTFYYYNRPLGTFENFSWQLKSLRGLATSVMLPQPVDIERTRLAGERLLFTPLGDDQEVWITDGSPQGTHMLIDAPGGGAHCGVILCEPWYWEPEFFGTPSGRLFYSLEEAGPEELSFGLWTRDPPAAYPGLPPQPVPATRQIYGPGFLENFRIVTLASGGRLLYFAGDPVDGRFKLYSSDGSEGGQRELLDPGGLPMPGVSAESGGITYLVHQHTHGERELWRTDGLTAAGTYKIRGLGYGEPVESLWPAGGKIFFALETPATGSELWVSDGTTEGTHLLAEGQAGPFWGNPREFHTLPDGRVVFAFSDVEHGREPWISDGTAAGTHLLEDGRPGQASSNPSSFVLSQAAGRLFFVARDATNRAVPTFIPFDFGPPPCPAEQLCLHGDRFRVEVEWIAGGQSGLAHRALASEEAGVFTFFSPDNWELMVKVLDGCALNQNFWVFAAAATDVQYEIRVTDTYTHQVRSYPHLGGTPAPATTDIAAFATCGAAPPEP